MFGGELKYYPACSSDSMEKGSEGDPALARPDRFPGDLGRGNRGPNGPESGSNRAGPRLGYFKERLSIASPRTMVASGAIERNSIMMAQPFRTMEVPMSGRTLAAGSRRSLPEQSGLQGDGPHADGPLADGPHTPGQERADPEADQANRDGSRERQDLHESFTETKTN